MSHDVFVVFLVMFAVFVVLSTVIAQTIVDYFPLITSRTELVKFKNGEYGIRRRFLWWFQYASLYYDGGGTWWTGTLASFHRADKQRALKTLDAINGVREPVDKGEKVTNFERLMK